MKTFLVLALGALCSSLAVAQPRPQNPTLRGFVTFRERILPPPDATVHVALTAQIPGESVLPLSSTTVGVQGGRTPFQIPVPAIFTRAPLQLNAWIVQNGRVWMRSSQPTPVVDVVRNAEVQVGIVRVVDESKTMKTIDGEVFKLDRRALAPNARVIVELRDVSLMDARSPLVASQTLTLDEKQLPVAFRLQVPAEKLQVRRSYAISARVYEGDRLSYLNDTRFPVDAQKAEQTIRIRVVPVSR